MGRKKHTAEPIIGKLREAEIELAKGQTTADAVRKLGITEQTKAPRKKVVPLLTRHDIEKLLRHAEDPWL